MDYATSRGQLLLLGSHVLLPRPCWHPEHTAYEGATVQLPSFPRSQERVAVSAKAELLPLRSHTSFSFIIHGCKAQASRRAVTTLKEKRMTCRSQV